MLKHARMACTAFLSLLWVMWGENMRSQKCNSTSSKCNGVAALLYPSRRKIFANEGDSSPFVAFCNQLDDNNPARLTIPYGDHPVSGGRGKEVQRLDIDSARALCNEFATVARKHSGTFGGFPFYKGHPDDPRFRDRDKDQGAYGWITSIAALSNELELTVAWSNEALELIAEKRFRFFSPRWDAVPAGRENGVKVWSPISLISAGLTNRPNIAVRPISNEELNAMTREELIAMFGLDEAATDEEIQAALSAAVAAQARVTELEAQLAELQGVSETAAAEMANERAARTAAETALATSSSNLVTVTGERNEAIANEAVASGRITLAEHVATVVALCNDYDKGVAALKDKKSVKTGPAVKPGGDRQLDGSIGHEIRTLVNEVMASNPKMSRDAAWAIAKQRNPTLFEG